MDSVFFEEPAPRLLVSVVGEDLMMLGSDYPHPPGERPAGVVLCKPNFLTETSEFMLLTTQRSASWAADARPRT